MAFTLTEQLSYSPNYFSFSLHLGPLVRDIAFHLCLCIQRIEPQINASCPVVVQKSSNFSLHRNSLTSSRSANLPYSHYMQCNICQPQTHFEQLLYVTTPTMKNDPRVKREGVYWFPRWFKSRLLYRLEIIVL